MDRTLYLGAHWDIVPVGRLIYARRRRETIRFGRRPCKQVDLLHLLRDATRGVSCLGPEQPWMERLQKTGLLDVDPAASVAPRYGLRVEPAAPGALVAAPESGQYPRLTGLRRAATAARPVLGALRAGDLVLFAWATCEQTIWALRDAAIAECERCHTYGDLVIGRAALKYRWPGPSAFWRAEELRSLDAALAVADERPDTVLIWRPDNDVMPWKAPTGSAGLLVEQVKVAQATPTVYCASATSCSPDLTAGERTWQPWVTSAAGSPHLARVQCLMEVIERYAGSDFWPPEHELIEASWHRLGPAAVDPGELGCLSPCDPESLRSRPTLWCRAHRVDSGKETWLPLQSVTLRRLERPLRLPMPSTSTSGTAAHTTPRGALKNAVLELCEREALMIAWTNGLELPRIAEESLPTDSRILLHQIRERGYDPLLCDATMDLVPVVLAMAIDMTGRGRVILKGSAAGEDPSAAVKKALFEAHAGLYFNSSCHHRIPRQSEIATGADHMAFHSRPDRAEALRSWLMSGSSHQLDEIEPRDLWEAVERAGLRPISCDITPPMCHGFASVTRVLVPGMVPFRYGNAAVQTCGRESALPITLNRHASSAARCFNGLRIHPFF